MLSAHLLVLAALLATANGCANRRAILPTQALRPLSLLESHLSQTPSWWEGFRRATDQEDAFQLVMLEPYQPGKTPVVLVHGLLSSPETWKDLLASCYADATLRENFQFWVFHYPTGITYLESARQLRRRLLDIQSTQDPTGSDAALSNAVVVGHSMGGLIAKLQVATSGDYLWKAVAAGPIDELEVEGSARQQVQEMMFFEPVPGVKRVIYIATPHYGARVAANPFARFGKRLITFSNETRSRFEAITQSMSVLREEFAKSIPTSIDHLSPESPVMQATVRLPVSAGVHQHSILGSNGPPIGLPSGDGFVAFESARWPESTSENVVNASHTEITTNTETIAEIQRILHLHIGQPNTNRYELGPSFPGLEPIDSSIETIRN